MPIFNNKIFIYLATRYLTYGLQFVLSLIIAVRLGPYYLGVYGMVQLVLSYFAQINFGIPHSLNVFLVHNKNDKKTQNEYSQNTFALFTYINMIVVIGATIISILGKAQWGEYDLGKYLPLIVAIAVLTYYNNLLTTIIRFRNQVNLLSLVGTIPVITNLITVWFFDGESLVLALTTVNLLSCIATTIIGYYKGAIPKFNIIDLKTVTQKKIIRKGVYLFLYNSCFYFILIVVRTVISANYSVEEFGYFTFSYTIANAVMLLLDSFSFIIFPKTIDLLSGQNEKEKESILEKIRVGYITTSHLLIYIAMICFPLLIQVFSKYEPSLSSMNMIALAILMNTNSYGYNTLLIAQNKERVSSHISIIALMATLIASFVLVKIVHVGFSYVIISQMFAYMIFSLLATYECKKLLSNKTSWKYTLLNFFPIRLLTPYSLALVISAINIEWLIFAPLFVFFILNYKDLDFLKNMVLKIAHNPKVIDV